MSKIDQNAARHPGGNRRIGATRRVDRHYRGLTTHLRIRPDRPSRSAVPVAKAHLAGANTPVGADNLPTPTRLMSDLD
jgi:hypothetical protein